MRYLRSLIIVIIVHCFSVLPIFAQNDFLNTPRKIRIGLDLAGTPEISYITSSNNILDIFDVSKKKTIFSGKASKLTIKAKAAGSLSLTVNEQKFTASGSVRISNKNPRTETLTLTPSPKKAKTYRGTLEVKCSGFKLFWINIVDIEDYLKSVVPSEISTRAPKAAVEAQAIAARTYAIRNIDRHLKKTSYNLCDTVHCQAYFGISKEDPKHNEAIKATEGKILVYNDTPANTVYHSNCGGYIISSQAAWGGQPVPYLIGHYDGIKGKKSFCEYGKSFLSRQTNIVLPEKSKRLVIGVTAHNSKKKTHSNYGHRVGMCQDGAIGMALIGYSCSNILGFYYPKTKIETLKYAGKNTSNQYAPTKVTSLAELKSDASKKKQPSEPVKVEKASSVKDTNESESNVIAKAENKAYSENINSNDTNTKTETKPSSPETDKKAVEKTQPVKEVSNDPSNDEEDTIMTFQGNGNGNNKLKSVLKEIGSTKPNTAFKSIRKHFWNPIDPKVITNAKINRKKK